MTVAGTPPTTTVSGLPLRSLTGRTRPAQIVPLAAFFGVTDRLVTMRIDPGRDAMLHLICARLGEEGVQKVVDQVAETVIVFVRDPIFCCELFEGCAEHLTRETHANAAQQAVQLVVSIVQEELYLLLLRTGIADWYLPSSSYTSTTGNWPRLCWTMSGVARREPAKDTVIRFGSGWCGCSCR